MKHFAAFTADEIKMAAHIYALEQEVAALKTQLIEAEGKADALLNDVGDARWVADERRKQLEALELRAAIAERLAVALQRMVDGIDPSSGVSMSDFKQRYGTLDLGTAEARELLAEYISPRMSKPSEDYET